VVDDYIKEKRNIIMAVVSCKNDCANEILLAKCREVDPTGNRTIGIFPKPDFLEPGSDNEASWMKLVQNKDIFFELGCHMLKNRSEEEANKIFAERSASESAVSSQESSRDLPLGTYGINALRRLLSQLRYKLLKAELPALQKELGDKYRELCRELERLVQKRATYQGQRRFLMGVSQEYQDFVKAALNGQYEQSFFDDLDPDEAVDHNDNVRRV
jgi:hypothetical protein